MRLGQELRLRRRNVSAVTGLVQQAFPYITGKQIVDMVLSTANRTFTLPAYTVTFQQNQTRTNGFTLNVHK